MSPDAELQKYIADLPRQMRAELSAVISEEAQGLSDAQRDRLQSMLQPPEEEGDLLESCRVDEGAHDLEKMVRAGGDLTTDDDYDHALGFEYGTSRQPARSFFWSTIRERREAMFQRIGAAVQRALG
ncbi:MAG: hypothetical protein ACOY5F_04705 [Pseudomonadota bacterium]